jgi:hypothetical protein
MPLSRPPIRAKALPIEISIPALAAACSMTRWKMLQRLKECEVPLRRKGAGTLREHVYTTIPDIEASPRGHVILDAIRWNDLFIARLRRPEIPDAEEGEDDDEPREMATKGKDGKYR